MCPRNPFGVPGTRLELLECFRMFVVKTADPGTLGTLGAISASGEIRDVRAPKSVADNEKEPGGGQSRRNPILEGFSGQGTGLSNGRNAWRGKWPLNGSDGWKVDSSGKRVSPRRER